MLDDKEWTIYNPQGVRRVIVTKALPGKRWLEVLTGAECRVDVCESKDILMMDEIRAAVGDRCDGAFEELTETWGTPVAKSFGRHRRRAHRFCICPHDGRGSQDKSALLRS